MLFSSISFLLYFLPLVVLVNYLLSFSRFAQNLWLFAASLFFYAWGEPVLVFAMILSIGANTLLGIAVDKVRDIPRWRGFVLVLTCALNLGFLFVMKYLGFAVRNINAFFGATVFDFNGFALPIGISFYTFQALSYVIDVYRKDAPVEKNPFYVGLYIAFFPQLIAGPIVRYSDIAEQIRARKLPPLDVFCAGCCRFVAGMGKKVLIANSMAAIADHVYSLSAMSHNATVVPVTLAWIGMFAYTFQIYYDFSGYSDMALGLAQMFGFHLKENFNYPYIANSMVDFWRRWHISLSTWFREYVYFPLGGSRVENNDLMVRNTFIVWFLTGLWHGAEWTFILWGFWNLAFIMLERLINFERMKIPAWTRHVYLLFIVNIGWMFFRAQDLFQAFLYLRNAFGMNDNGFFSDIAWMFLKENWVFFFAAALCSMPVAPKIEAMLKQKSLGTAATGVFNTFYPVAHILVYVICLTYLAKGSYNPFIYFNF